MEISRRGPGSTPCAALCFFFSSLLPRLRGGGLFLFISFFPFFFFSIFFLFFSFWVFSFVLPLGFCAPTNPNNRRGPTGGRSPRLARLARPPAGMHPQRMKQAAAQQQLMQQALLLQQQQAQQPPLFPGHHHPHPGLLAAPQVRATLCDFSFSSLRFDPRDGRG